MSAEDNVLKTTFRELGLSKQRRKTEKIEISLPLIVGHSSSMSPAQ